MAKYQCGCIVPWGGGGQDWPWICPEHKQPISEKEEPMLNPEDQQRSEQAVAHLAEFTPHLLWNYYKRLQQEGFSESQAFELCKVYMHGFGGGKLTT